MHIWIFNPYEPLPHEGAVRLRYASLAAALVEAGHSVTWWSMDWSHALKQRRSPPPQAESAFDIQLVPVPAYANNISWARVRSHRAYARGIAARADTYVAQQGKPDVILFSVPPMEAGAVALDLGKRYGARVVLDVMDAWPDALLMATGASGGGGGWTALRRAVGGVVLLPYRRLMRRYGREADGICAQSEAFARYARRYGATGEIPVFHLCASGREGQERVSVPDTPETLAPASSAHPLRIVYLGSMGRIYDLETLVAAVLQLHDEGFAVTLDLIGEGAQRVALTERVAAAGAEAVIRFHGFVEGAALDTLMANAEVGVIPMFPESGVAIPYKAPDYLSRGLFVINSLPGELVDLLTAHACGLPYEVGNVASLVAAIRTVLDDPARLAAGQQNARKLAEAEFESDRVHAAYARWIADGEVDCG